MDELGPAGRRVQWLLVGIAALVALTAWIELERTAEVGGPIVAFLCSFAGLALASSLSRTLSRPGGIDATVSMSRQLSRSDPIDVQNRAVSGPTRPAWLTPLFIAPAMAATLPIALHTSPGDRSIVGVLAFFVLLLGPAGLLAGLIAWFVVVLPLLVLGRLLVHRLRGRPADSDDSWFLRVALLIALIFLFATALVLPRPPRAGDGSTHSRDGSQLAALIGVGDQSSPWLWVSRVSLVAIVALCIHLSRTYRPHRPPADRVGRARRRRQRQYARLLSVRRRTPAQQTFVALFEHSEPELADEVRRTR